MGPSLILLLPIIVQARLHSLDRLACHLLLIYRIWRSFCGSSHYPLPWNSTPHLKHTQWVTTGGGWGRRAVVHTITAIISHPQSILHRATGLLGSHIIFLRSISLFLPELTDKLTSSNYRDTPTPLRHPLFHDLLGPHNWLDPIVHYWSTDFVYSNSQHGSSLRPI